MWEFIVHNSLHRLSLCFGSPVVQMFYAKIDGEICLEIKFALGSGKYPYCFGMLCLLSHLPLEIFNTLSSLVSGCK